MIIKNYLKTHKFKIKRVESKSTMLLGGFIGLKSLESGILELNEYNAIKLFLKRNLKKKIATIWYRNFPEKFVTKKSAGNARMGKGKGNTDRMVINVTKGQILFEIFIKSDVSTIYLIKLLKQCNFKLSVKTKIIFKKQ